MAALFQTGEFYALACALVWAIAVVLFRQSVSEIGPIALNLFKNTLAALAYLLTMLALGLPFLPAEALQSDWAVLFLSGVIGIGVADSLFFASLRRLGAGRQAIVDCAYSPCVLLCAWAYLGEEISIFLVIAIVLMVLAILIGTYDPRAPARRELWKGVCFGVAAVGLMALGIVIAKPVLETSEVWWATTVRLLGGISFLTLFAISPKQRADIRRCFRPSYLWRLLVPASLIGTYLALLLWIMSYKYTEQATLAGLLNQSSTIFILILAALFLKEPITRRKLAAITLGLAGVVLATAGPQLWATLVVG